MIHCQVKKWNPCILENSQIKINLIRLPEMLWTEPLHFNDFIIAGFVVERICSLGEIIHDVARIKNWDPGTVVPRNGQGIF